MNRGLALLFWGILTVALTAGCVRPQFDYTPTPTPTLVPTPTITPLPPMPPYSAVVRSYPEDMNLCASATMLSSVYGVTIGCGVTIYLVGADRGLMSLTLDEKGSNTIQLPVDQPQIKSYGVKIFVVNQITLDRVTYNPGTLLTVDNQLQWIVVSSWK